MRRSFPSERRRCLLERALMFLESVREPIVGIARRRSGVRDERLFTSASRRWGYPLDGFRLIAYTYQVVATLFCSKGEPWPAWNTISYTIVNTEICTAKRAPCRVVRLSLSPDHLRVRLHVGCSLLSFPPRPSRWVRLLYLQYTVALISGDEQDTFIL